MKAFEIQPTPQTVRETYINDTIGRRSDVNDFVSLLNSLEGAWSIALAGSWGSGKTFFVQQAKLILDTLNDYSTLENKDEIKNAFLESHNQDTNLVPHKSIYYDAWLNDNDEDPLLSLVYSIMKDSIEKIKISKPKDLGSIIGSIVDAVTGRNISQILKSFTSKNNYAEVLENIEAEKELQKQVYIFFDAILAEKGNRLVIFIDELDRCKPTYAINLLERIKHYCLHDKVSFVFSINISELTHVIKKYYGTDFDAIRYLDRFFNWSIPLPQADMNKFFQNIDFTKPSNIIEHYLTASHQFIKIYNLELREITKYVQALKRIDKLYISKLKNDQWESHNYDVNLICCFIPIIIGLYFVDYDLYKSFLQGENSNPFVTIMKDQRIAEFLCKDKLKGDEELITKDRSGTISIEEKLIQIYHDFFPSPPPTTFADFSAQDKYRQTREYVLKITTIPPPPKK